MEMRNKHSTCTKIKCYTSREKKNLTYFSITLIFGDLNIVSGSGDVAFYGEVFQQWNFTG